MRIPFLFACCLAMACDARVTGIEHELYTSTIWQMSDGSYLIRIQNMWEDGEQCISTHDFVCDNLRHADQCPCMQIEPRQHKNSE